MSRWLVLAFGVLGLGCCTRSAAPSTARAEALKNWALSRCLSRAQQSEGRPDDDAAKSAAAYLEAGTAPIEVYERMDALAIQHLERESSGSVTARYDTMKCIELYHSDELDRLVDAASR